MIGTNFILPILSALAVGLVLGWTLVLRWTTSYPIRGNNGEKPEEVKTPPDTTRDTPLNDGEDFVD